ncbi:putative heat repeat protein [Botrytis fragariae]|uniref:Putative heat repeat protein n=1 Tax=Botrytis fragariae TaxID=1964551 RepID=A0A8H6AQE9_9HELO|nr:putative heat repeat protein [Botrytis fragariae]KAF5871465.1 putative heat repeat protein [Botrytis fragariae]
MDSRVLKTRNEIFQELKPYCVDLSQLALKNAGDSKSLISSTENLLGALRRTCDNEAFDEKLADYVFFPLSQILRSKQKYTDKLSELTLKCLRLLLEQGWRNHIAIDLAKQLLILLTLMIGGVPGQAPIKAPEELVLEALAALAALFDDLTRVPEASVTITAETTIPAVGHCITSILDAITDGPSTEIQSEGLNALKAAWNCIRDVQAHASFLPGTVSALTKCLTPTTTSRRSHKTIVMALESLLLVLTTVLSDVKTRTIRTSRNTGMEVESKGENDMLTKSWLTATTSQIKLSLANVVKLRTHKSNSVRVSLNRFCIVLLDECHDTLVDSTSILVETCLSLVGAEDPLDASTTSIVDLATIHSSIGESIKKTCYDWVTSLPRVMQMSDETAKVSALHQLSASYKLLSKLDLRSSILDEALSRSLRDGLSSVIETSSHHRAMQEVLLDPNSQALMMLSSEQMLLRDFPPILMPEQSQKSTRTAMVTFLRSLNESQPQMTMASEMLEYVRQASGPSLLAAYWISSQLIQLAASQNEEMNEFFESTLLASDDYQATNHDLYSYSISVLSSEDHNLDWRVKGIALEVVSNSAKRLKKDFRAELVDILYPVSQLLGSTSGDLRGRATICLNTLAQACEYPSTRELIVENVDYMVNAISLRLNTFDISPQAPQVLIMMIQLTGPSLLLYLDDVVSSIFAALDNFHGYQGLVEGLFAVLGEIVEMGSQSRQLRLPGVPRVDVIQRGTRTITVDSIVQAIEKQQERLKMQENIGPDEFPREPWKSASALLDDMTEVGESNEDNNVEVEKIPVTKTYNMVQSIIRLCQHYLTNPSPTLRTRLLGLIRTSSAALQSDEESFLPLVNDIWPVVIDRLYDKESHVAIAAADSIAAICRSAGNFLNTRIATQWPRLIALARQTRANMLVEKTGTGGRGIHSQAAQMWESVVKLLMAIVECTGVNDDAFDDVLDLLARIIPDRSDVRDALSAVNADAVWLVLQSGLRREIQIPSLDSYMLQPPRPLIIV